MINFNLLLFNHFDLYIYSAFIKYIYYLITKIFININNFYLKVLIVKL